MTPFDDLPIRSKLMRTSLFASSAALLLACAAFVLFDLVTFSDGMVNSVASHAAVVGLNSTAALTFDDAEAARTTLSSLKVKPNIVAAAIYDRRGNLFARYEREAGGGHLPPRNEVLIDRQDMSPAGLQLIKQIRSGPERVGSVLIEADLSELGRRVVIYLCITVVVLAVALLLSVGIAGSLAGRISQPILALVDTARAVASDKDYSQRAATGRRDELGRLADSFNEMLAQIQQREQSLQRTNRELEDFARVASHDMQEPLRKLQAFAERLRERAGAALDDQSREYIARMQESAARMRLLVDDLLNFARAANPVRAFRSVALDDVMRAVLSDLVLRVEQSGAKIEVGALPTVEADPTQMYQLLQNLISNALKFQAADRVPRVKVYARNKQGDDGRYCEILIEDNGIGFEQKFADRIFMVFQRLHGRSDYAGTGMGLAVCRKIVDQHGGSIAAHGDPGRGAVFTVTLPYKQPRGVLPT